MGRTSLLHQNHCTMAKIQLICAPARAETACAGDPVVFCRQKVSRPCAGIAICLLPLNKILEFIPSEERDPYTLSFSFRAYAPGQLRRGRGLSPRPSQRVWSLT